MVRLISMHNPDVLTEAKLSPGPMGDFVSLKKNQLRTLVFVSWCYTQCFPCRGKSAFGCIRDSDLLQSCASKARMRPFEPPSRGCALAGAEPAAEEPLPFAHSPGWGTSPRCGSSWSVGWRSAGRGSPTPTRSVAFIQLLSELHGLFFSQQMNLWLEKDVGDAGMCLSPVLTCSCSYGTAAQPSLEAPRSHSRPSADPDSPALLSPRHSSESCTRRSYTKQFSWAHYWTKLCFELTFSGHGNCFEAGRQN